MFTTIRRRRGLVVLAAATLVTAGWWLRRPIADLPLTLEERTIVGQWALQEDDPSVGYVNHRGVIKNPWYVRDYGEDRTFRLWVVSGTPPTHRCVETKARWFIHDGKLCTENFAQDDPRAVGEPDPFKTVQDFVAAWAGLPSEGRPINASPGSTDLRFRFPEPYQLELTGPFYDAPCVWRRTEEFEVPPVARP